MPSEGWWSRHRLFPALSLTLTVPLHSRVHCSSGCARVCASSIFSACANLHCVLQPLCCYGQRESVLPHLTLSSPVARYHLSITTYREQ